MKSSETYRSGIYSRLDEPSDGASPVWYLLPGLYHIFGSDQKRKGMVLFLGALFCLTNIVLFFFYLPCANWCQSLGLARFFEAYNQSSAYFRLSYSILIGSVLAYILYENKKDLDLNFHNFEADGKPVLFGGSLSGSYLLSLSLLIFAFFYGVLNLIQIPKEKSLEIEMTTFVNNPPQKNEPKEAPKVNRISSQNALDSGKFERNKPVAPEQSRSVTAPKPRTNPNPQKIQAPPRPQQASKPQPASKPQQQSPYQKTQSQSPPSAPPPPQPKQLDEQLTDNNQATKPKLPSFKPKASNENSSTNASNPSTNSKPAEVAYNSPYGGQPALRAPVLAQGSRNGGFSSTQSGDPGNAAPNNNPNGPVSVAAKRGPVDYGPFMQDLQRRIQQAWHPSKTVREEQVVLTFELYKTGRLVPGSLRTLSTSTEEAEMAAKQAVLAAAASFRPLPDGAADQVRIDFTFTKTGIRSMGSRKY